MSSALYSFLQLFSALPEGEPVHTTSLLPTIPQQSSPLVETLFTKIFWAVQKRRGAGLERLIYRGDGEQGLIKYKLLFKDWESLGRIWGVGMLEYN